MGNNIGSWEAHIAVKHGDPTTLKNTLVSGKLKPNMKFRGETLITTAITQNLPHIVQLLLDHGADPNLASKEGGRNEPPIITATRYKNFEIVQILVNYGANLNATNFYGHDAIFQAVVENAFEILEYLLQRSGHGCTSHKVKEVCPFLTAVKDASIFPLKNQCLLTLLRYNYRCKCLIAKSLFVSEIHEYEEHKRLYESIIATTDTLRWVYLSHSSRLHYLCRFRHTETTFSITGKMKLSNLARIVIRENVSTKAMKDKANFYTYLSQLPLPTVLIDFLLMKDVSKIVTFNYNSASHSTTQNKCYCFIL